MHPAVVLGVPVAALVGVVTLGLRARARAERRAEWAEMLALAARRGVALARPVEHAADAAPSRRAARLRRVANDLHEGVPLSFSLRTRLPKEFPSAVCEAIHAGERASRLPEALDAIAAESSRDVARRHRVALATFYPVLLFVGVALLNLLVLDGRLCWITRGVVGGADPVERDAWPVTVVRYGLYVVGAVAACWALMSRRSRRMAGPGSARVLETTALLLDAGRSLDVALEEASSSAGSTRLARAMRAAARSVEGGEPVASVWQRLPIARAARERLAAAADAGLLPTLRSVARALVERDERAGERLIRWSAPVATMAAGLLVAIDYAALAIMWTSAQAAVMPW